MKRRREIVFVLSALAAVLAMLVVVALVAFFYDVPHPDDSDLRPIIKNVANEDNAIVELRKLSKTLKIAHEDFPELGLTDGSSVIKFYSVLNGNSEGDERMVRSIIAKNKQMVSLLFAAMEKPELQFDEGFVAINKTYRNDRAIKMLNGSMQYMQLRWKHMLHDGILMEVMDELFLIRKFALRYTAAPDGFMNSFLMGLAADAICLRTAMQNIGRFKDKLTCLEISRRLSKNEISKDNFITMMRGSYVYEESLMRLPEPGQYYLNPISRSNSRYFYKPNMTRARLCQLTRDVIKNVRNDIVPVFDQSTLDAYEKRDDLCYLIRPNSSGEAMAVLGVIESASEYIRVLNLQASTRQIACAFALRAYWLDHHALPETLDVLVPAYIDSVPEDPFIKKPMQYNASKALLYCAGPERLVDDGSFAFEEDAEPFGRRAFVILDWAKK